MRRLLVLFALVVAGCLGPGEVETAPGPAPSEANGVDPGAETPTAEAPVRLASGNIVLGGPHVRSFRSLAVLGVPDVDGFFLKAPPPATNVTTVTLDRGGLGYDLDFNFHDASGKWLGGCQTPKPDEVCLVPAAASRVEVAAYAGRDLDVAVFTAPGKPADVPRGGPLA